MATLEKSEPICVGYYAFHDTILGKGNFACVYKANHNLVGCDVALKVIDVDAIEDEYVYKNLTREARILRGLRHPNIVRLYETVEANNLYCLSLELVRGTNLAQFMKAQAEKRITEKLARVFFFQMLTAVEYMHSLNYIHRDLKQENVLIECGHVVKIVDFGLSNVYYPCYQLRTHCGSAEYAAPELFRSHSPYGTQADLWSLGVILYAMVIGKLPFKMKPANPNDPTSGDRYRQRFIQRISKGLMQDNWEQMEGLSPECWDLLHHLLQPDQFQRLCIGSALRHPWIIKDAYLVKRLPQRRRDLYRKFEPEIAEYLADKLQSPVSRINKHLRSRHALQVTSKITALFYMVRDSLVKDVLYPPKNVETSFLYRFEIWRHDHYLISSSQKMDFSNHIPPQSRRSTNQDEDKKRISSKGNDGRTSDQASKPHFMIQSHSNQNQSMKMPNYGQKSTNIGIQNNKEQIQAKNNQNNEVSNKKRNVSSRTILKGRESRASNQASKQYVIIERNSNQLQPKTTPNHELKSAKPANQNIMGLKHYQNNQTKEKFTIIQRGAQTPYQTEGSNPYQLKGKDNRACNQCVRLAKDSSQQQLMTIPNQVYERTKMNTENYTEQTKEKFSRIQKPSHAPDRTDPKGKDKGSNQCAMSENYSNNQQLMNIANHGFKSSKLNHINNYELENIDSNQDNEQVKATQTANHQIFKSYKQNRPEKKKHQNLNETVPQLERKNIEVLRERKAQDRGYLENGEETTVSFQRDLPNSSFTEKIEKFERMIQSTPEELRQKPQGENKTDLTGHVPPSSARSRNNDLTGSRFFRQQENTNARETRVETRENQRMTKTPSKIPVHVSEYRSRSRMKPGKVSCNKYGTHEEKTNGNIKDTKLSKREHPSQIPDTHTFTRNTREFSSRRLPLNFEFPEGIRNSSAMNQGETTISRNSQEGRNCSKTAILSSPLFTSKISTKVINYGPPAAFNQGPQSLKSRKTTVAERIGSRNGDTNENCYE